MTSITRRQVVEDVQIETERKKDRKYRKEYVSINHLRQNEKMDYYKENENEAEEYLEKFWLEISQRYCPKKTRWRCIIVLDLASKVMQMQGHIHYIQLITNKSLRPVQIQGGVTHTLPLWSSIKEFMGIF